MPHGAPEWIVNPDDHIDLCPLEWAGSVVVAIQYPAACSVIGGREGGVDLLAEFGIRCLTPVWKPEKGVELDVWKRQGVRDASGEEGLARAAGPDDVYLHGGYFIDSEGSEAGTLDLSRELRANMRCY